MNSFWIPKLGGQIYAMPAMRAELHMIADKAATFRGHSANISGKGFASMNFPVKATSEEEFTKWINSVKESSKKLTVEEYKQLVKPSEYVPPVFYQLKQDNLFDLIIKQYEPNGSL